MVLNHLLESQVDDVHLHESDLSRKFNNLSAIEIVDELKDRFIAQVRILRFECMNEFLSTKIEENTCLEQHLRKMHKIYYTLVDVWNYKMNDDFAIDGVLRSLPPQLQELCQRLCHGKGFDHFL